MPIYEFKNEQGVIEEHYFEMKNAPSIGTSIVVEDRLLIRLPPRSLQIGRAKSYHFVARSQPTLDADGRLPEGAVEAPRYDRDPSSETYGHALFSSKREVDDFCARSDGRCSYGK